MTRINFDMIKLRLQKSIFLHNPSYRQPSRGEVIALGLSLRNAADFSQNGSLANFLQCFKTQTGPDVPFSLEVEFAAVFALSSPAAAQADQDTLIHKLFPQLVFPYTREYVAETTRRGGYPPLILNLGLFQDSQTSGSGTATESICGSKWPH
ncbi:MAG: protein-export chaperone SecB [Deltaproteobacteria bacterium]|jgi:hypothetical protein|nr:protein-export chaperone SecB [Deltaproteobacteria bacterium]